MYVLLTDQIFHCVHTYVHTANLYSVSSKKELFVFLWHFQFTLYVLNVNIDCRDSDPVYVVLYLTFPLDGQRRVLLILVSVQWTLLI